MSRDNPLTTKALYDKADEAYDECSQDPAETLKLMDAWLRNYYADPENRAELADSPHKSLPVNIAIDLLMQDVANYIRKNK